ncbi:MAG: hypothetical protein HQ483_17835 [Rhodospirillales bacterium]|nr:hypothetical protein [Rhodospirillales bacterium]
MTAPGYVFVDLNRAPDPEPVWKRCWFGREDLWKVFWGWFFFGHGVILGCSVGVMTLGMILGFATNPASLNAGFAGMATGATLLVLAVIPYGIWCGVSLWRCAGNCINQGWGYGAQAVVIVYAAAILTPLSKLFIDW